MMRTALVNPLMRMERKRDGPGARLQCGERPIARFARLLRTTLLGIPLKRLRDVRMDRYPYQWHMSCNYCPKGAAQSPA